jgi:hypothetical protein
MFFPVQPTTVEHNKNRVKSSVLCLLLPFAVVVYEELQIAA